MRVDVFCEAKNQHKNAHMLTCILKLLLIYFINLNEQIKNKYVCLM